MNPAVAVAGAWVTGATSRRSETGHNWWSNAGGGYNGMSFSRYGYATAAESKVACGWHSRYPKTGSKPSMIDLINWGE